MEYYFLFDLGKSCKLECIFSARLFRYFSTNANANPNNFFCIFVNFNVLNSCLCVLKFFSDSKLIITYIFPLQLSVYSKSLFADGFVCAISIRLQYGLKISRFYGMQTAHSMSGKLASDNQSDSFVRKILVILFLIFRKYPKFLIQINRNKLSKNNNLLAGYSWFIF